MMTTPPKQFVSEGLVFLGLLVIVICAGIFAGLLQMTSSLSTMYKADKAVVDFASCAATGHPVMETYPRQCRSDDGRVFTEIILPIETPEVNTPGGAVNTPEEGSSGSVPGNTGSGTQTQPSSGGTVPVGTGGCIVGGCSAQLCVDAATGASTVTTCEYRAEYACYRNAVCERQQTGLCGWTSTPALMQCLKNPPALSAPVY